MIKILSCFLCAAMVLHTLGCAAAETVRVGGTGSAMSIMTLLATDFMAAHPDIQVSVFPSLGSGGGIKAAAARAVEIAVTSRPLTPEEADKGLTQIHWAKTPLVFAVSDTVPVTGVTSKEVAAIYAGQKTHWTADHPIRLILRPLSDTETTLVAAISPALDQAQQSAHNRPGIPVAVTDTEAGDMLESVPDAFGSSTLGMLQAERRHVRVLALDGVHPSLTTLKGGSYPHAKDFFLVTARDPTPAAGLFQAFLASDPVRRRLQEWNVLAQ